MNEFDVILELKTDKDVTIEEFNEWFKAKILDWGTCSDTNPLLNKHISTLITKFDIL